MAEQKTIGSDESIKIDRGGWKFNARGDPERIPKGTLDARAFRKFVPRAEVTRRGCYIPFRTSPSDTSRGVTALAARVVKV